MRQHFYIVHDVYKLCNISCLNVVSTAMINTKVQRSCNKMIWLSYKGIDGECSSAYMVVLLVDE